MITICHTGPQIVLEKDMGKFKILSVLDDNGAVKKLYSLGPNGWDPLLRVTYAVHKKGL